MNETEEMTAVELLDKLPVLNHSVIFTKDNLRVKLDELVEKGYITSRKDGRNVNYGLASDIWSDFTNEELADIWYFFGIFEKCITVRNAILFGTKAPSLPRMRTRNSY